MRSYKMVTTITDHGPYVSKLILELPFSIRREEVTKESFHVYVERLDEVTQELFRSVKRSLMRILRMKW